MHAHVGTFTTWDDQPSEGIYSFAVDPTDGTLEPAGVTPLPDPTFLAVSSRGVLYAATHTSFFEGAPGAGLVAYAVDAGGSPRRLGQARVPSPHPVYVALDRAERHVLVASGLGGAASTYAIGEDGVPGAARSVLAFPGDPSIPLGTPSRLPRMPTPGAPHPHCIVASPDGAFVLVANMNQSRVHVLRVADGELAEHAVQPSPPGTAPEEPIGARHLVFHPDGSVVYVLNESDSSISVFAWDPQDGRLDELHTVSTLPAGAGRASKAADLQVHPSGHFLYASNRGHDSLAAFAIEDTGRLRAIGHAPTGRAPRGFTLTPDGGLLLVANQDSGDVRAYRIDEQSGTVTATGARTPVPCPVCVRLTGP